MGTPASPQGITSTGTLFSLTSIGQGSNNLQRIGNNAQIKHLTAKVCYYANSTDISNQFRCIVYQWNDDTAATTAAILEVTGNLLTSCPNVNNVNTGKLRILSDQIFSTAYGGTLQHQIIEMPLSVMAQWSTTGVASAIFGDVGVLICSDSTAVPSPEIVSHWCLTADQ